MLSPRVPNLVPIPGPRMERETPGQRPRPNYGHPQGSGPMPGICALRRKNLSNPAPEHFAATPDGTPGGADEATSTTVTRFGVRVSRGPYASGDTESADGRHQSH